MKDKHLHNVITAGLTSVLFGLLTVPGFYIASGVLSQFPLRFSYIFLPFLAVALFYLLSRYLIKACGSNTGFVVLGGELLCWLGVVIFVFFASAARLQQPLERVGLTCFFSLLGALAWLPLVVGLKPPLLMRVRGLKTRQAALLSTFMVFALTGFTLLWWLTPSSFI